LDNTLGIDENQDDQQRNSKQLHIVSLGYSWRDKDFASYILSRKNYIASITISQLGERIPDLLHEVEDEKAFSINIVSTEQLTASNATGNKRIINIDQLLWALWNGIETSFKREKFPYVPISRHLILGSLFGPHLDQDGFITKAFTDNPKFINDHTTEKRLYAEVYLHLIKCKGMVNSSNMALDPRLNFYFKVAKDEKDCELNKLDRFVELGQSRFADVKETYFARSKNVEDLISGFISNRKIENAKTIHVPHYIQDEKRIQLEAKPYADFIEDHLGRIYNGPEVEIVSGLDVRAPWIFDSPVSIDDHHAMQKNTSELLTKKWSHLFVIAETGAWMYDQNLFDLLKEPPDHLRHVAQEKRIIYSIKASNAGTDEWLLRKGIVKELGDKEKELSRYNEIINVELPWWEHNRHLTLAYDMGASKFLGGIYFRRRLKTSRISPIRVDEQTDCVELFFTFLSYLRRVSEDPFGPDKGPGGKKANPYLKKMKPNLDLIRDKLNACLPENGQKERLNKLIDEIG